MKAHQHASPIKKIVIAKMPCQAPWFRMRGNDLVRRCSDCMRPVYNAGSLTEEQLLGQIQRLEEWAPQTLYRRADGRVQTLPCPALRKRIGREKMMFGAIAFAIGVLMPDVRAFFQYCIESTRNC